MSLLAAAAAAAKSLQSCLTLCDPIDRGQPTRLPPAPSLGFTRQEHWSVLPFPSPMHEKWKVKVKSLSRVRLLATPWTVAYQAPPFMGELSKILFNVLKKLCILTKSITYKICNRYLQNSSDHKRPSTIKRIFLCWCSYII